MHIRQAHPEDIPLLSEFWYDQMAIWQQNNRLLRLLPDARDRWEAATSEQLQSEAIVFLTAEIENTLVGGIIGEIVPNLPGVAPQQIGLIRDLIVDNHSELGRGVGRELLEACITVLRERGIQQVQVRIPTQAAVQQAFWRGVGASNGMDIFWMVI
ncbi:MAG: GNAT family N-acetyltransferase [Anaerolineae bacterium]|nr:GNAT family N-acetyltransferase [Anaerolineae bacterium]